MRSADATRWMLLYDGAGRRSKASGTAAQCRWCVARRSEGQHDACVNDGSDCIVRQPPPDSMPAKARQASKGV
eukprot:362167-Chlamydomonas_euryale.AAC.3